MSVFHLVKNPKTDSKVLDEQQLIEKKFGTIDSTVSLLTNNNNNTICSVDRVDQTTDCSTLSSSFINHICSTLNETEARTPSSSNSTTPENLESSLSIVAHSNRSEVTQISTTSTCATPETCNLSESKEQKSDKREKYRLHFLLEHSVALHLKQLSANNPRFLQNLGIADIQFGSSNSNLINKTSDTFVKTAYSSNQARSAQQALYKFPIEKITSNVDQRSTQKNLQQCLSRPFVFARKNHQHNSYPFTKSSLSVHQQSMQQQSQFETPIQCHNYAGSYSRNIQYQSNPIPMDQIAGTSSSTESPLLVNLLSNNTPFGSIHQPHEIPNPSKQVQQTMTHYRIAPNHMRQPPIQSMQDVPNFLPEQLAHNQQQMYLPSTHQRQQSQPHLPPSHAHNIPLGQNYMMHSQPSHTIMTPGPHHGMNIPISPALGCISSLPVGAISQQNAINQVMEPATDQPKTKRKRISKKQQAKEEKDKQLRAQQELQTQQRMMVVQAQMPQQEFFMISQQQQQQQQQQRMQIQQAIFSPMNSVNQQIHQRMQFPPRMMQTSYQQSLYHPQSLSYNSQTSYASIPGPSNAQLTSPQFSSENSQGYIQTQQQQWTSHPPQQSQQAQMMVHYGINSQQQQQMPSTPNEYQQYNPPLQHFGQQQSPYQQQSLYNQQTPQTYQDHRQHSSLGNSNYNFSVGDPGTPIPRIPSTPHTPQQLPQQHPGSGSGGGRSSFHSHPSTPGSVGLQQGFNSPTAGCIVPTANAYSQQQAQHSETNQFQKQEPQISLFPSLSDYASANIDDINVAASNDADFDLDSIEPTMHSSGASNEFKHQPKHHSQQQNPDSRNLFSQQSEQIPQQQPEMSAQHFHSNFYESNQAQFFKNDLNYTNTDQFKFTEPQHNSGPQSPSKLSEIQQQNVTDCIHAVVERVMYDNKERPQKKKPGPPKGRKRNASNQKKVTEPSQWPNQATHINFGAFGEATGILSSRTPTPQTPVLSDTHRFGALSTLSDSSSIHSQNSAKHYDSNVELVNRARTSSIDSVADQSSVSSHHSSTAGSNDFNSPQLNGHYNPLSILPEQAVKVEFQNDMLTTFKVEEDRVNFSDAANISKAKKRNVEHVDSRKRDYFENTEGNEEDRDDKPISSAGIPLTLTNGPVN